jgi:FHA domain
VDGPSRAHLSLVESRRRGPRSLLVTVGDVVIPLPDGEWVVGRSGDAAVRIDDDRVSRRHAVLRAGPHGWEMVDGGSLNGIWLEGRQVQRLVVPAGGVTVLIGGREGVQVRLAPDRAGARAAGDQPAAGDVGEGPAPAPGTSPAGVRFQQVTPEWSGWTDVVEPAPEPEEGPAARLRSFVRNAVDATRGRARRGDPPA